MEQRLLHGAGGVEVVTFAQERQLIERAQVGFVVDDEKAEVRGGGHPVSVRSVRRADDGAPHVDEELVAPRLLGRRSR